MNFPLFLQGVPAIDIPVTPTQYPMLNFMPAIQVLKMNQKQPAAATEKADNKEPDIDGVIGQVQQWQDLYDAETTKASKILAYLGEDAIKDPNYKRAINEANRLQSPSVKNTLKENKANLERFKANTSKYGAYINLEQGFNTGIFSTNSYWSSYLDQSQTQDVGKTNPNSNAWIKNFNFNHVPYGPDDAIAQIKENNKTGTSQYNYETSFTQLDEFANNTMAGLLKTQTTSSTTYQSNTNKYGEQELSRGQMPKDKDGNEIPAGPGQLDYALEENKRQALQNFNLTSKINSGLLQDFAQRTAGYVPSTDPEMSNQLMAFKNRMDIGLSPEEKSELDAIMDGYYYKKGTIIDGVDVGGQLNSEALISDYKEHANDILAREYGAAKIDIKKESNLSEKTFYGMNEEETRSYNATKEAEAFANGALQAQNTVASTYDQGYTEEDMLDLLGADKKDESFLGGLASGIKNFFGFGDDVSSSTVIADATSGDPTSPFSVMVGSDGKVRYIPKNTDEFSVEEYRYKIYNKVKKDNPDWTDKDVNNEVNKRVNAATKLVNNANQRRYSESGMGEQRTEYTQLEWTSQAATPGFITTLQNAWFGKGANGEPIGKKANEVLGNVDIKVGETVVEGRSFLGNIPIVSASNNLMLSADAYASNCGFRTEQKITLDGREIPAGTFVHMSKLDGVSPAKINELINTKSIFIGSGYWTKDGKKDGQNPDRTSVTGMGTNGKNILDAINSKDRNNPQAVLNAAGQYRSTVTVGGNYDMVVKELTGKTFKHDVPQYALDPAGLSALELAQKTVAKNRIADVDVNRSQGPKDMDTNPQVRYRVDINKTADELGLVGKNRQDFIIASKDKSSTEVAKLAGKYYGQQKDATKNWSMQPVLTDVQIVKDGVVNQAYKNTVGWQETGSGSFWGGNGTRKAYFNVDANVTQAMQRSQDKSVRVSAQKGMEKYYEINTSKKSGQFKDIEGKKIVLPNVNALK